MYFGCYHDMLLARSLNYEMFSISLEVFSIGHLQYTDEVNLPPRILGQSSGHQRKDIGQRALYSSRPGKLCPGVMLDTPGFVSDPLSH